MSTSRSRDTQKDLIQDIREMLGLDNHDGEHPSESMLEMVIHYYENLIGNMPGNVYWLNRHGKMVGCNKNVLTMLGLHSLSQFRGLSFEELGKVGNWSAEAIQSFRQDTMEVIHSGIAKTDIEEPPIPHHDGRILHFLTHRVPLKNTSGDVAGVVGISIDITERKQLEQALKESTLKAEAASHAKSEFLANMRHDIRTPLTGILGFAELLKMEPDASRISEYAENLVASSHALLDLLDEVLEAVRVSSGEIPMLRKKFSLKTVLNHIIALNQARAAQKKLALTLTVDPDIPEHVISDRVRIHRVALELVVNALNFTDSGFVKMSAMLAKRQEGRLVLKIVVEDSGMGIPKDRQQEIYLQFRRLTPSYQGIYRGAGLGLSVVKQFVDELGGEIYVESETGMGSRFTCLIPVQEPLLDDNFGIDEELESSVDLPREIHNTDKTQSSPNETNATLHHILIVEDHAIAGTVAKSILAELGCVSDIAQTGKSALEHWKSSRYDLIFMDIGLPDIEGYEVARQIRIGELARKVHVPIIALTAHAGDENRQRCIESGMNAVLTKPLTMKSCAEILDAFVRSATAEETSILPADTSRTQLDNVPLLDIEEGKRVIGSEQDLVDMLRYLVKESLPEDFRRMKAAHNENNWEKTCRLAHKIKGGAVYVGTTRMKLACQSLERPPKSENYQALEPLYQEAVVAIEATMLHVCEWLKKHPG